MKRRELIAVVAGAVLARPLAVRAEQSRRMPRLGVLLPGTPASFSLRAKAFVEGLQRLGYVEGQTIAIKWKWGEDKVEGLPGLAAALVEHNVDVIITGERRLPRHSRARPQRYRSSWRSSVIRSPPAWWTVLRDQVETPPGSASSPRT